MTKPDAKHLCAERRAILSSCCGLTGEVTLTDSAVILLFAGMLGAGDMLSLITTSVLPLFNGLLILPMAWWVPRAGRKTLILGACSLAACAYFMAGSAPFFGSYAVPVLISMILLFAMTLSGFIAGWFPMLDTFLSGGRRTLFFGRMRFFHQLTAVLFLFLVSAAIGKTPPLWKLQAVLYLGAFIFMGRIFFIAAIPDFPVEKHDDPSWLKGLRTAAGNRKLRRFSVYQFVLNLAVYGSVPLALLYLKNELKAPDNVIVFISAAALSGMLLGYLLIPRIIRILGLKYTFIALHALYLPVNIGLFFIEKGSFATYALMILLLMLSSFAIAATSIVCSAEMMALATPGNKTMAMAFSGALYYSGAGLSRLLASFALGSGLFASAQMSGGMAFGPYRTLFLLYAAGTVAAGFFLFSIPAVADASCPAAQPEEKRA